jgi:Rieske 2Fe-2S family protein
VAAEAVVSARGGPGLPFAPGELDAVLDPAGTGSMLPAAAYTDGEVLAWEREHFFARAWVCAARSDELRPGARTAVRIGDDAVLLVRDHDGVLRGFFNVCRHRGSELQSCGTTVRRGFIDCPYHAWRYALDGRLTDTPRFAAPPGFRPDDHGLVPVRVEEWRGWVMVNLSGDAPALADYVGDLDALLAPYAPERLVVGATHTYASPCNWKLPIENYHECFHCRVIHPQLCVLSPPESGDNYHRGGMWVGGTMDLADGAETMSVDGRSAAGPLPGLTEAQRREVVYVHLFPNLLISAHPDYVMTHRIEPVGPAESFIECRWLFAPEPAARPGFDPAYAVDFWDLTNRQDWAACEAVQRGLRSRGYRPGPLALDEDAVTDWVRMVAASYRSGRLVGGVPGRGGIPAGAGGA